MACGCPVLATVATGAEDLFTDGEQGFIVADRDTERSTERIQQVADDRSCESACPLPRSFASRVSAAGSYDQWDNCCMDSWSRDPEQCKQGLQELKPKKYNY